jgi:hypothetical protein
VPVATINRSAKPVSLPPRGRSSLRSIGRGRARLPLGWTLARIGQPRSTRGRSPALAEVHLGREDSGAGTLAPSGSRSRGAARFRGPCDETLGAVSSSGCDAGTERGFDSRRTRTSYKSRRPPCGNRFERRRAHRPRPGSGPVRFDQRTDAPAGPRGLLCRFR